MKPVTRPLRTLLERRSVRTDSNEMGRQLLSGAAAIHVICEKTAAAGV